MQTQKGKATFSPDPKERRKKRGKRGIKLYLMLAITLIFCVLTVGVGYALHEMNKTLEVVTKDPYQIPAITPVNREYEGKNPLSFVIVGVDTRKNIGMLNTDVLVVAVANPVTQKLTMVSLPRDTRVEMPGYPGYHKVNEVFALGENIRKSAESKGEPVTENGMTLLKKTLEQMLGIPVEHYVQLDFEGFTAVIDSLGGVTVDVDRELVYELPQQGVYRTLKKGRQVVNGEQALGFVRHRVDRRGDAYNSSDFDRNRRQQQVLRAVADKVASIDGLSKLTQLLETMGNHIRTDLSAEQIKGLALDFASLSSQHMVSLDNGAVWKSPYSLWPQKNMQAVRAALQAEMGEKSVAGVKKLSDAAVAEFAQLEPPAKPRQAAQKSNAAEQAPPASPHTPAAAKEEQGQVALPPAPDTPGAEQPAGPPGAEQPALPEENQPVPGVDAPPGEDVQPEPYPADLPPPDILAPPVSDEEDFQ